MIEISLEGTVYDFSNDYGLIDTENVLNLHEYLTKKNNIK